MKIIFVLFFIGTIASATEEDVDETSKDEIKQSIQIKNQKNRFSAKLFTKEIEDKPRNNEVQSGFAALPVLAMLCLASSGETHLELHDTLGLANDKITLNEEFVNLDKSKTVIIKIANRVYVTNNVTLNKEFAASVKTKFDSEIQSIDFLNLTNASTEINNWFDNRTDHNITNILSSHDLNPNTSIVAVSAIYFHGNWEHAFDKNKSTEIDFHVSKEKSVKVLAMHGKGLYKYVESKSINAKILELPYAENNTAFYVVLPTTTDGLQGLEEKLKNNTLLSIETHEMATHNVNISLPKFRIETKTCLKRGLKNLNIKQIFNATSANLHKMLDKENEQVYVNEIIQKSVIEICECGVNNATSHNNTNSHTEAQFQADHPFIFFVKKGDNFLLGGVYAGQD